MCAGYRYPRQKWTFNQSIQYNIENMGSRGEGEVRRYIMLPGQAVSYYMGYLKILDLRQKAKDRLGSQFNLKTNFITYFWPAARYRWPCWSSR